jgi:hypothetical protein
VGSGSGNFTPPLGNDISSLIPCLEDQTLYFGKNCSCIEEQKVNQTK